MTTSVWWAPREDDRPHIPFGTPAPVQHAGQEDDVPSALAERTLHDPDD
jgi:hypothetical protein